MGKKTCSLKNKKLDIFKFSFPFVFDLRQVPPLAQGNGCKPHHGTFNTTNQEQQCDKLITTLTIERSMAMVRTW
jgi:hypothetical protein